MTLFNHRVNSFWTHQNSLTDDTAHMYVNAMIFKHPDKVCQRCDQSLYGVLFNCDKCTYSCCLKCTQQGHGECPLDGPDTMRCDQVVMPPEVVVSAYHTTFSSIFSSNFTYFSFVFSYFQAEMNSQQVEESRIRRMGSSNQS